MATAKKAPRASKTTKVVRHPHSESNKPLDNKKDEATNPIELVFGFVGPTGVDLTRVCSSLQSQLKTVGYETKIVRLSELIMPFIGADLNAKNEYQRIERLMTEGPI